MGAIRLAAAPRAVDTGNAPTYIVPHAAQVRRSGGNTMTDLVHHRSRVTACAFAIGLCVAAPALAQTATAIVDLQRGLSVSVTGTVERITDDDEFRLTDETGTLDVYIGPNPMPVQPGDAVTVQGIMDDDPGPLELYARQIILPNGQTVALRPDD
jgi:uncharacterized protein YdeI (BOF family)